MNIIQRGPCERYRASATPIKPWGVLLHTTEGGTKAGLDDLFIHNKRADGVTVSVHFAVYSDGEVRCYAPWEPGVAYYCYHAGASRFTDAGETVTGCSAYFIGIEIQHRSGQVYTDAQIASLLELLKHIQSAYQGQPYWRNILTEHRLVAYPRGRKSDPTVPWSSIKDSIYSAWNEPLEDDMTAEEYKALTDELAALRKVTSQINYDLVALGRAVMGDYEGAVQVNTNRYGRWPGERGVFPEDTSVAALERRFPN
jgi:N-acetyl-anhydromuramyl-L-alanine amidase AmpD